jgi:mRNA interferase MazF
VWNNPPISLAFLYQKLGVSLSFLSPDFILELYATCMKNEYIKDFDGWNLEKKRLNSDQSSHGPLFNEREIWWASMGINIGREIDGKNGRFERPVLIIRKFSSDTLWAIPVTKTELRGTYFYPFKYHGEGQTLSLLQMRLISSSRLSRRIANISEEEFRQIRSKVIELLL